KQNLASQLPDVAARLRARLKGWCAELNPPGLALGPMAATWNDYFDFYLEGKPAPKPGAKAGPDPAATRGWQARGGSLIEKEGVLVLTPDKAGKGTFITRSQLRLAGPVTASMTFKTAASGQGAIAWRMDGDQDFLPANHVPFEVKASADWQTNEVQIPAKGRVIHVRIHLPAGPAQFRSLDLLPVSLR
ncbi:MAG: aryl-sulfate sulfohydrolase, partial [Prosthecobacter sp.]